MEFSEDTRGGLKVMWREAAESRFQPFYVVIVIRGFVTYTFSHLISPVSSTQKTDL